MKRLAQPQEPKVICRRRLRRWFQHDLRRRAATGEGREHLLVERAQHQGVRLAARRPDFLQHVLELRFGECPLRAVDTGDRAVGRRRVSRATGSTFVGVGSDP